MTKIINFDNYNNKLDFTIEWEECVVTELKSYQFIKSIDQNLLPFNYIAYPWVTLIDYYNLKYNKKFNSFYQFLDYTGLLDRIIEEKSFSFTVIQSYHFNKYLYDFQKMGIKYIFSPHIIEKDFTKYFYSYDIIILPYYIFPSITSNHKTNKSLLYNFIGNVNYSFEHPTKIRNNISNLQHPENTVVKKLDEWHFNQSVYSQQLKLINSNSFDDKNDREEFYKETMNKSIFSICPLGIGPNSIRLWESFTYNCIPVSISDNLWFPFYIDVNWNSLIININESESEKIINLKETSKEIISKYQENIKKFNLQYLNGNFGSILLEPFKRKNKVTLLIPWFNQDETSLRYKEIHQCLERNLENNKIKEIIFFYEVSNSSVLKEYNHPKIKIVPVITPNKRDISFNRLVRYANEYLKNELCVISNNDIFFDDTISELFKLDFYKYNYFISLTRKNCDKYLDNNNNIWKPHSGSQDSWFFVSPLKLMDNEINLGWIQCDNIISETYHRMNYNVINPHYSINAWHLHQYNNTDYLIDNFNYNYKYKMKRINLETIDNIKKISNQVNFITKKEIMEEIKTNKNLNISKLRNLKNKWNNKSI